MSIVEGVERRLMAERRCTAIIPVVAAALPFSSGVSGSGLGGLSGASLEAAIGHLEIGWGAVVGCLQDVVAVLSLVEVATCKVASNSQAIRKELVGLSRLVRDQVSNMQGSVEEATSTFHQFLCLTEINA